MVASVINTNVMSLNSQRHLNRNSLGLATALERLSSGLRINSARDDASGLAVSISLESTGRGLSVLIRNEADKISTAQTTDGALGVATDILQRMRELAVQSQGTNGNAQAAQLQKEYDALDTTYNAISGKVIIDGDLGIAGAAAIITKIDGALTTIAGDRATLGATIASAEFNIQNMEVARENTYAARSRIMDADFAAETANLTRHQILQQAGTAMVAQANQIPSNVLTLLR